MTYSREMTHYIVECWGLGLTAEETIEAILQTKNVKVGLATIYRHRHSITAQQIIDELIRKQLRDIAKEGVSDIRMKYRDKLLEKFIPKRFEAYLKSQHTEKVDISVDIKSLLEQYETVVQTASNRNLRENNSEEQVDTAHTHATTS